MESFHAIVHYLPRVSAAFLFFYLLTIKLVLSKYNKTLKKVGYNVQSLREARAKLGERIKKQREVCDTCIDTCNRPEECELEQLEEEHENLDVETNNFIVQYNKFISSLFVKIFSYLTNAEIPKKVERLEVKGGHDE